MSLEPVTMNIQATSEDEFDVGVAGPKLKNTSEVLEIKDNADTFFNHLRAELTTRSNIGSSETVVILTDFQMIKTEIYDIVGTLDIDFGGIIDII